MTISTRRFQGADGISLVADVGGPEEAPTVILAHGGGQTRHSWSGAMQRLIDEGYHVINFDARGHGESDWVSDGDYSLRAQASDLQMLTATASGPVALVGASMGGASSLYAVGHHLVRSVRALILVDIVLRPAAAGVEKIRKFMTANPDGFATLEEAADAVAAYNPERPRPSDPKGLRKNLRLRDDGRLYWHWDPRMLAVSPSTEPPARTEELIAASRGVTIPTLVIRGGHSDIVDDEGIAEMLRLVPQTEIYNVADAGHMVAGDRNDAFNTGAISFLRRHLPAV